MFVADGIKGILNVGTFFQINSLPLCAGRGPLNRLSVELQEASETFPFAKGNDTNGLIRRVQVLDLCLILESDGQRSIVNRASEAETSQIAVKYGPSFTGRIHWHA